MEDSNGDELAPCGKCSLNQFQSRKTLWIQCTACRPGWFHVACLGLSGRAAQVLRESNEWRCGISCSAEVSTIPTIHPTIDHNEESLRLDPYYPGVRVIKRIPKGARNLAANKMADLIDRCVEENVTDTWSELFHFSWRRLYQPGKETRAKKSVSGSLGSSLTTRIKNQLNASNPCPPTLSVQAKPARNGKGKNAHDKLAKLVDQKLAEGDIRGAVRAVSSTVGIAPCNQETAALLEAKHPSSSFENDNMDSLNQQAQRAEPLVTCEEEVEKVIRSFPQGSSGGPDGIRPAHIKDLISRSAGNAGLKLLSSITRLTNLALQGAICPEVLPIFYGARLVALEKKDGGVRPIAVGNTFRRIAAKVLSSKVQAEMGNYLRPVQLGYGTQAGCEAAVHSVRQYLNKAHSGPRVMLKGDYLNAFNFLARKKFLEQAAVTAPGILGYAMQAYGQSTKLFFGEHRIVSACGVQQGDPLGPLLFSLGVHPLATSLLSEVNVWYLDDLTILGDPSTVLQDLIKIQRESASLGLTLNNEKSEVIIFNCTEDERNTILNQFRSAAPGMKEVPLPNATLLGSPLARGSIRPCIEDKISSLEQVRENLKHVGMHNGLYLLKNCFLMPKLL